MVTMGTWEKAYYVLSSVVYNSIVALAKPLGLKADDRDGDDSNNHMWWDLFCHFHFTTRGLKPSVDVCERVGNAMLVDNCVGSGSQMKEGVGKE